MRGGGKFVATLLENMAPKTCKAVWEALPTDPPIESKVGHASYSGEATYIPTPDIKFKELENLKVVGLYLGDVTFNPDVAHNEFVIVYRNCLPREWCETTIVDMRLNHFAKIAKKV